MCDLRFPVGAGNEYFQPICHKNMGHIRRVWPTIFWLIRYIYIYCELKSHETLIDNHMNTEQKLPYESPQTEVVELKVESLILSASSDQYQSQPW